MRQALGKAIKSDVPFNPKQPLKKLIQVRDLGVLDVGQLEAQGLKVVPWTGMWVGKSN